MDCLVKRKDNTIAYVNKIHNYKPKKVDKKGMSLEKVLQVISVPFGIAFFAVARVAFRTLLKYWSNNS